MLKIKKIDLILSLIVGVLSALMIIYISDNLSLENHFFAVVAPYTKYLLIAFPVFCALILILGVLFSGVVKISYQLAKFCLVGGMNFLLDMGILNFLVFHTGIAAGASQSGFKGISFMISLTSSYFWNKYWTFESRSSSNMGEEAIQFFAVSMIGFGINLGINYFVVNFVNPFGSLQARTWAQFGGLAASVGAMAWNFIGYKLFVFNNKQTTRLNEQSSIVSEI